MSTSGSPSPYLDPATLARLADDAFDLLAVAADGRLTGVNRAFERVLGWSAEELTTRPFLDFVHPDDRAATQDAWQALLRGEALVDFENRWQHCHGGWRWIQWRCGRMNDGRVHAVAREFTDQRRERQLIERTHRIARVGGWQVDLRDFSLYWTEGTYRLHEIEPTAGGISLEQAIAFYAPEDRPRVRAQLEALGRDGTPFDFEATVISGRGRRIDVRAEGVPIIEDGQIVGAHGAVGDITERKAAEALVRKMETQVRTAPNAVFFATPDRRLDWLNPAAEALFGLGTRALGRPTQALFSPASNIRFESHVRPALQARGIWQGEMEVLRPDGQTIPVTSTVVLHRDPAGQPTFLSVSLEDLRNRRRLEQQIRHTQRLESVGQLAGGLAHDFNNLLTVVLANGDELSESLAGSPLQILADEMIDAARRGARITRRLLNFARRDAPRPQPVDLLHTCLDLTHMLRRTLGEHIAISIEPARENWPVQIDPTHLEQLVVNLAMNSRDAMPEGGHLDFRLESVSTRDLTWQTDVMRLTVADTGHGMPPEVVARAFEPFFSTKSPDRGSGLGLPTCLGLVEQAGGQMRISSVVGEGTRVSVELPRASHQPIPAPTLPGTAPPLSGLERVLFIEDEPDILRTVTKVLRHSGYRVEAFGNAEDAIAAVASAGLVPDIIVTDVVLPGLDGPAAVRRIRGLLGDVPVIYTSGYAVDRLDSLDLMAPAVEFLRKPYTPRQLGPIMRRLLD